MSVHFSTAASGPSAGALYRPAATGAHGCHRPHGDEDAEAGPRRRAGGGLAEALRAALEAYASSSTAPGSGATTTSATADTPPVDAQDDEDPAASPRAGLDREALRDFTHALLDALRASGAREVGHGSGRHLQRGHAWGRGGGDLAQRLEGLAQRLAGGAPATETPGATPSPIGTTAPPSPPEAAAPSDTGASSTPGPQPTDPSTATAAQAPATPAPALPDAAAGAAMADGPPADALSNAVKAPGSSASAPAVATDPATTAPAATGASATPDVDGPTGPLSALENAFATLWESLPSGGATRTDAHGALVDFLHALAAGLGGTPTYGGASPYAERATAGVLLQARA